MKTTIFLSIIFLFISQSIKAQDKETLDSLLSPRRLLFEKPHTKFQFNLITSKGRTEREYGEVDLQSRLGWSYFLMWSQTHHFNPTWGVEYGFSIGGLPRRYRFDLKTEDFEALDFDYLTYRTELIDFVQFPLNVVYRKPVSSNLYLQLRTGISLRYILLEESISRTTSLSSPPLAIRYYESYSEFDNNFRINFNLGAGISWLLPNNDFLDFQIIANLSPRNIVYNDYYFFPDTPDETFGHYLSNGNYVGVSVGYTFTKVRKILRQYRKGIR
jgi:hypothetical protein